MNPAVAATGAGVVVACFVPIVRDQITEGEIGIPLTGNLPVKVRRIEHPLLFWASVAGQIALMLLIAVGAVLLALQAYRG